MLVFDGHNDLLLNLWLYHRDAPAEAFYAGVPKGHLDFPRMQQGGFAGGLFAVFVPPQDYLAQVAPARAAQEPYDPLTIMWQQLAILQPGDTAADRCAVSGPCQAMPQRCRD